MCVCTHINTEYIHVLLTVFRTDVYQILEIGCWDVDKWMDDKILS